jgi:hypothetical protein
MTPDVLIAAPAQLEAARSVLADLDGALANMPDRRDVPNTQRALDAFDARRSSLSLTSSRIKNALHQLPQLTRERDAIALWIERLTTWKAEFQQTLEALPMIGPDVTREQHQERMSLVASLRNIDQGVDHFNGRAALGRALKEKILEHYTFSYGTHQDPWDLGRGSLPSAQEWLTRADAELADVQQQLDAALSEAARLLS